MGKRNRPTIELEEDSDVYKCVNGEDDTVYYYQPITLTIIFKPCDDDEVEFTMDCDLIGEESECENVEYHKVKINDEYYDNYNFNYTTFYDTEKVRIRIKRKVLGEESKIIIKGYNPKVVFDERLDDMEFKEEIIQKPLELEVK